MWTASEVVASSFSLTPSPQQHLLPQGHCRVGIYGFPQLLPKPVSLLNAVCVPPTEGTKPNCGQSQCGMKQEPGTSRGLELAQDDQRAMEPLAWGLGGGKFTGHLAKKDQEIFVVVVEVLCYYFVW